MAGRNWIHAVQCDPPHFYGAGSRGGVSLRTSEHRRRGPALCGCVRSCLGGNEIRRARSGKHFRLADRSLAGNRSRSLMLHRGNRRGRDLGRHSRSAESEVRIA